MRGFPLSDQMTDHRHHERGYMLLGAGALILVIVGLLSSYAFVVKRDSNYKSYYALGERFADTVTAAHFYAQQQVYSAAGSGSVAGNCALLTDMDLPDGMAMRAIGGTTFELQICGADLAPVNATTPAAIKAASAYVQLKIRGQQPSRTDLIAMLAGAASRGLDRAAFIGMSAEACDGGTGSTRWGPDASACLTPAHLTTLGFNDVAAGDIIIPAWETALAQANESVIYRYPQPERPDMNSMSTDLGFTPSTMPGGIANDATCQSNADLNCLTGINELRTSTTGGAAGDIAATRTVNMNDATVRAGSPTIMQGAVTTADQLRIYNEADPNVLTVAGTVDLTGTQTGVGGTMQAADGGNLEVTSAAPIMTNTIEPRPDDPSTAINESLATTVDAAGGAGTFIIDDTTGTGVDEMNMTRAGGRFNLTGTLGTGATPARFENLPGDELDIYAATMNMNNGARATNTTNDLDWEVQTIDQRGRAVDGSKGLFIDDLTVRANCIGKACPDSVNEAPPPGGL